MDVATEHVELTFDRTDESWIKRILAIGGKPQFQLQRLEVLRGDLPCILGRLRCRRLRDLTLTLILFLSLRN